MVRKKTAKRPNPAKRKAAKAKSRAKPKARARSRKAGVTRRVQPVPQGYHSVTPYLAFKRASDAIEFYKKVFGAKEKMRLPDGERIAHAEILVGSSHIMLADEYPGINFGAPQPGVPSAVSIMLYVPDVDAAVERAVRAGATIERPLADQFYGDRTCTLVDPYGHRWFVATHVEDVSPGEMQRRMQALQQPSQ